MDVLRPGHGLNGPLNTFCHPGQSGVISCPCANPPIAFGRGCDNSAATGGASLYWSGNASLGNDTLVFATSFERPHALSILMQGTVQVASGMVYGQGIRCVGGTLRRLFFETSDNNGAISAPGIGETVTISQRSAQRGDPLSPGDVRYYMVYYRDPIVLGACPPFATFNDSVAAQMNWSH